RPLRRPTPPRRDFLSLRLRLGVASVCRGMFDLCVDLATGQKSQSGNVKPDQKDHCRAQRTIGLGVGIEELQTTAKLKRNGKPGKYTYDRTGCDPVPVLFLHTRTKEIDDGE